MEVAAQGYKPDPGFELVSKDPLIDLCLSDSKELWLLQLPVNPGFLADIDGKELSLKIYHDGRLGSFEDSSGKVYDLFSFDSQEPDATVFLSSSSEPKIGSLIMFNNEHEKDYIYAVKMMMIQEYPVGNVSRRVSFVHFPDPQEFERISANKLKEMCENSAGTTSKSSCHFTMQSAYSRISKSKHTSLTRSSSKHKSSLSEVRNPSRTPKRSYALESNLYEDPSNYETPKLSRRGQNSTATSSLTYEHSSRSKLKKRAHPA